MADDVSQTVHGDRESRGAAADQRGIVNVGAVAAAGMEPALYASAHRGEPAPGLPPLREPVRHSIPAERHGALPGEALLVAAVVRRPFSPRLARGSLQRQLRGIPLASTEGAEEIRDIGFVGDRNRAT